MNVNVSADAQTLHVMGDMEFHMGCNDETYDGASVSFWSGSDSNIAVINSNLAAYSHPEPPERIMVYETYEKWMNAAAESHLECIENAMSHPEDEDVRRDWEGMCYYLSSHELLSTGGLTVHRQSANKVPTAFQAKVAERYLNLHADEWPQNSGMRDNIRREMFDILHAEKLQMLRSEEASARKRATKVVAASDAPRIYQLMDKVVSGISRDAPEHELISKTKKLCNHVCFDRNVQARWAELIADKTHLGKVSAKQLVKKAVKEVAKADSPHADSPKVPNVAEWSDHDLANWSQEVLSEKTDEDGNLNRPGFAGDI